MVGKFFDDATRSSIRLEILKNANSRFRRFMEVTRQLYPDRLIARKHNGLVKAITGARGCGKSYLLIKLFKQHLLQSGASAQNILVFEFGPPTNKRIRDPEILFADIAQKT